MVGLGGLNTSRKTKRGRKFCASCKKVFGENEAKVTYDHVKFYCCGCDDEKNRVAEIETALARNDILSKIDQFECSNVGTKGGR